jgi:nitrite reductase/ring-hydroxylating ferredoxin subunit
MAWTRVASVADLEGQGMLGVEAGGEDIALYWVDGAAYATTNICTHAYARLSEGFLDGDCIECPVHQALFKIATGEVVSGPADAPLKTYPCRTEGGDVLVDI